MEKRETNRRREGFTQTQAMKNRTRTFAFTLIELLVVVAIIAILAALAIPAVAGAFKKSTQVGALSNMRQVGFAFMHYATDSNFELPGRVVDGAQNMEKWPGQLAGYDINGNYSPGDDYVKSLKIYIAPGYAQVDAGRPDLAHFLTSNSPNNTSWMMNGYNDIGAKNEWVEIYISLFTSPSETILLGMHKPGQNHFYMDFSDGDNTKVLDTRAYGTGDRAGSVYCMADGSARFITDKEYRTAAPTGAGCYGDWLWLANKSNPLPN